MRIDQVTPDLVARDAVGAHILNVQRAILSRGIESEIFYEDAADDMLSQSFTAFSGSNWITRFRFNPPSQ